MPSLSRARRLYSGARPRIAWETGTPLGLAIPRFGSTSPPRQGNEVTRWTQLGLFYSRDFLSTLGRPGEKNRLAAEVTPPHKLFGWEMGESGFVSKRGAGHECSTPVAPWATYAVDGERITQCLESSRQWIGLSHRFICSSSSGVTLRLCNVNDDEGKRALKDLAHACDCVVEATGNPHGFTQSCELLKPRGTLVLKVSPPSPSLRAMRGAPIRSNV